MRDLGWGWDLLNVGMPALYGIPRSRVEVEDVKLMPCALTSRRMALVMVGWDVTTADLGDIISFRRLERLAKEMIASTSPLLTSAFAPVDVMGMSSTYVATATDGWLSTNLVTLSSNSDLVNATENLQPAMIDLCMGMWLPQLCWNWMVRGLR